MLSCKDIAKLASEGLDRKLSLRERISLRVHTTLCSACRAYRRQIKALCKLVSDHFRGDGFSLGFCNSQSLSDEARQKIKEALHKKGHLLA